MHFECQIARYNLSAHADAVQIAALMEKLGPKLCYLVHGDEGARSALAPMIGCERTLLPLNGEVAEFVFGSSLRGATAVPGRARPVELAPAKRAPRPEKGGHAILDQARKAVALIEEIRQVGWRAESQELLLYVAFPKAFQERRAAFLRELGERFQVGVVVQAKNTAGELAELVRKHLPAGARLVKPPSLFPDGRVVLKIRGADGELLEKLRRETGLAVEIETPGEAGEAREIIREDGRMELNAAYRRVREVFEKSGLAVLRCGKKDAPEEHIEVGLLAPWLLEGREELVRRLESETGYPIRASGANQQALEKRARELLPPAWQVLKPFRWSGREVRVALARFPEEAELQLVTRRLQDELGIFLRS